MLSTADREGSGEVTFLLMSANVKKRKKILMYTFIHNQACS